MILSAIGILKSRLVSAACMENSKLKSMIFPCLIMDTATKAASSSRSRSTTLHTSNTVIDGTIKFSTSYHGFPKSSALGPSGKNSSHPEESTIFIVYPASCQVKCLSLAKNLAYPIFFSGITSILFEYGIICTFCPGIMGIDLFSPFAVEQPENRQLLDATNLRTGMIKSSAIE